MRPDKEEELRVIDQQINTAENSIAALQARILAKNKELQHFQREMWSMIIDYNEQMGRLIARRKGILNED